MRRVDARHAHARTTARTLRVAAAALLSFFLGGAVVYETVKPVQHQPPPAVAAPAATVAPVPAANDLHDAWQSDELKDFHNVVEWEAWVPEEKTATNQESSL
ncbi:MAG TPA: hypothetical protein VF713_26385, partial [Thermoanaerobaculia bacterium]